MFMGLLRGRAGRLVKRRVSGWRSTRAAAFVREFNGEPLPVDRWAERFPRKLRLALVLALLGVTLVAVSVRAPLLGSTFSAPDTGY
jgi:hypothetical protein